MRKYRIFKEVSYDEYGKSNILYFFIKEQKSFLGITYWKKIKHREYCWDDSYKTITKFKSEDEAQQHVTDVLCKAIHKQKHVEELVKDDCGC